jgi:hypothetical protein
VITVEVGGPAWEPVAYDVEWSTGVSVPTDVPLLGSDPNGDPLFYVIESLPSEGSLSDPGAGPITAVPYELVGGNLVHYEPPEGQNLQVTFDFSVRDATAGSNVATVTLMVGGPSIVYYFPMDSDPGWSTQGDWAFGQPTGGGGEFGGPDPTGGHFGDNVYGYNLDGDYTNNLSARYLTTPALDFSEATSVELRFWRWLGVESSLWDHAKMQVSNDGFTWTTLWENGTPNMWDTSWTETVFDLSAIADGEPLVFIRWAMGPTDGTNTYCGWNIDDVEIEALVSQPETCEDGIQNQGEDRIDCGGPCPPCDCVSDGVCDDELFCTGVETCDDHGHCQPGTPVDCDDGVGCTVDSCDEVNDTCVNAPDDGPCDNGEFCDGAETCDPVGDCQAGTPVDCDDGVGCTADSCDEINDTCVNAPDDGLCDNGEFCDGVETCDPVGDCQAGEYPCGAGAWCHEGDDACIPHGNGDFDTDGDVDLGDFADFQVCFGEPAGLGCEPGNMAGTDAMIDLDDFSEFVVVLNGPQ